MQLGKVGVWNWLDGFSAKDTIAFAKKVEALGYTSLWMPEAVGRDPFVTLGFLAAHTERLVLATGIASIYARDPMATNAALRTLTDLSGGRFILGIGVSHQHLVEGVRGHAYAKPLTAMRSYLEKMEKALFMAHRPEHAPTIVLAALRDKMLQLAAEKVQGAHPYFVTPEHTKRARAILGPDKLLIPEQMVLRETDATKARALARSAMKIYLALPNYQNNLKCYGFGEEDFANGGSDRLVDAIVAWGDEEKIVQRIREHLAAGATQVAIQAMPREGEKTPDMALLEALSPNSMRW